MRIHAIKTGEVRVRPSQIIGKGRGLHRRLAVLFDRQWFGWVPTFAFALEHPDGVILIDTGATAALKNLPKWHPFFQLAVAFAIEREQEIGPQLAARGIRAADVRTVVLTHMHIDHDAGLSYFPKARVLVHAGELAAAKGALGKIRGYLPQRWPSWFDPEPVRFERTPAGAFAVSAAVTSDNQVRIIPTPGHTPHHISVIVQDGDAQLLFAGDASYTEENLLTGTIDGVTEDDDVARKTLDNLRAFVTAKPTVFLPTHDPDSAARLIERRTVRGSA